MAHRQSDEGNRPEQNKHLAHGKEPCFSGRVQISARNIGWYSDEIMDFVNQRQRSADTRPQRSSKDVWLSRTTALIGGIFKVVSIVKICLDILGQYKQF
jgi:hypothetical protein